MAKEESAEESEEEEEPKEESVRGRRMSRSCQIGDRMDRGKKTRRGFFETIWES
jgi:hypothetical protein